MRCLSGLSLLVLCVPPARQLSIDAPPLQQRTHAVGGFCPQQTGGLGGVCQRLVQEVRLAQSLGLAKRGPQIAVCPGAGEMADATHPVFRRLPGGLQCAVRIAQRDLEVMIQPLDEGASIERGNEQLCLSAALCEALGLLSHQPGVVELAGHGHCVAQIGECGDQCAHVQAALEDC